MDVGASAGTNEESPVSVAPVGDAVQLAVGEQGREQVVDHRLPSGVLSHFGGNIDNAAGMAESVDETDIDVMQPAVVEQAMELDAGTLEPLAVGSNFAADVDTVVIASGANTEMENLLPPHRMEDWMISVSSQPLSSGSTYSSAEQQMFGVSGSQMELLYDATPSAPPTPVVAMVWPASPSSSGTGSTTGESSLTDDRDEPMPGHGLQQSAPVPQNPFAIREHQVPGSIRQRLQQPAAEPPRVLLSEVLLEIGRERAAAAAATVAAGEQAGTEVRSREQPPSATAVAASHLMIEDEEGGLHEVSSQQSGVDHSGVQDRDDVKEDPLHQSPGTSSAQPGHYQRGPFQFFTSAGPLPVDYIEWQYEQRQAEWNTHRRELAEEDAKRAEEDSVEQMSIELLARGLAAFNGLSHLRSSLANDLTHWLPSQDGKPRYKLDLQDGFVHLDPDGNAHALSMDVDGMAVVTAKGHCLRAFIGKLGVATESTTFYLSSKSIQQLPKSRYHFRPDDDDADPERLRPRKVNLASNWHILIKSRSNDALMNLTIGIVVLNQGNIQKRGTMTRIPKVCVKMHQLAALAAFNAVSGTAETIDTFIHPKRRDYVVSLSDFAKYDQVYNDTLDQLNQSSEFKDPACRYMNANNIRTFFIHQHGMKEELLKFPDLRALHQRFGPQLNMGEPDDPTYPISQIWEAAGNTAERLASNYDLEHLVQSVQIQLGGQVTAPDIAYFAQKHWLQVQCRQY
jgi:hypothetical protein